MKSFLPNRLNLLVFLATVVVVIFLAQFPNYYRGVNTPTDKWYSGQASWFDPWDINVYFSAINWGQRGEILFSNLYDTKLSASLPIYPLYTLLGKIALPFFNSVPVTFHFFAVFFSFLLSIVLWFFLKIFFSSNKEQYLAFILSLGGGFGWLFYPQILTPDVAQPNFTLASAFQRPHEAISLGLYLLIFLFVWLFFTKNSKKYLFFISINTFVLLFFHPYSILPIVMVFLIFGIYCYLNLKILFRDFLFLILSLVLPTGIYLLLILKSLLLNPGFSGLLYQQQKSPEIWLVFLGLGFLAPLSFLGLFFFPKKDSTIYDKTVFVKVWFLVQILIIHIPFDFQKLLVRGLWLPAVILSVMGLSFLFSKTKLIFLLLVVLLVIFSSFSGIFMFIGRLADTTENRWIYLSKDEGQAITYLQNYGQNEEGVLASYQIANMIPAFTHKRVLSGHTFQTPEFSARLLQVQQFFSGKMSDSKATDFLREGRITWVFWGPEEKTIGNLSEIPYRHLLTPVLETSTVTLYKVIPYLQ